MNPVALAVPRDAVAVAAFVEDFRARHNGVTPIGGGDTIADALGNPQAPVQTAPPPPAAPQAPVPPPAAPVDPAAPQAAAPATPADQPPWLQGLFDRMDAMGPPVPVDPVLNDLGLGPATPPQPQQVPQQAQPPASPGLGQQAPPQAPGMPFPGQPMAPQEQIALIQNWIGQQVEERTKALVDPQLQQFADQRRLEELQGLRTEYPEFQDQAKADALVARGRQWARQMGNEDLIREPMFLEMVLHATRSVDAAAAAQAQAQPVPAGTQVVPPPMGYPIEQPGAAAPGAVVDPAKAISQRIVQAGSQRLSGTVFA